MVTKAAKLKQRQRKQNKTNASSTVTVKAAMLQAQTHFASTVAGGANSPAPQQPPPNWQPQLTQPYSMPMSPSLEPEVYCTLHHASARLAFGPLLTSTCLLDLDAQIALSWFLGQARAVLPLAASPARKPHVRLHAGYYAPKKKWQRSAATCHCATVLLTFAQPCRCCSCPSIPKTRSKQPKNMSNNSDFDAGSGSWSDAKATTELHALYTCFIHREVGSFQIVGFLSAARLSSKTGSTGSRLLLRPNLSSDENAG